ncbi:glycosyl hydrolase family 85-domain-containing protein [Hysterangium stoloniferum]|nr:glycosyl hydrolase family 85-domain-containing protein [Hysterangium stoloniferum]
MPVRQLKYTGLSGTSPHKDSTNVKRDFFDSIDQLAAWKPTNETEMTSTFAVSGGLADNIPNISRPGDQSKLLVCHDFKGGYTEDPLQRGYSFEFWHLVDTFIYFSHNRISLPPKEWINTGHRHGAKVLGTIIFEWDESKSDLIKCLYEGPLWTPEPSPSTVSDTETAVLPITTEYAMKIIKLAKERDFDGYLLNIETNLNFLPPASCYPGGSEERDEDASYLDQEKQFSGLKLALSPEMKQRRAKRMRRNALALLNWATWLTQQGKRLVGPHWEIIWYDSVTMAGELQWQDALTTANAPFFMNTDAIFTNYTWARPPDPAPPGGLPESDAASFEPYSQLPLSAQMAESLGRPSADVFVGIDVFGRGCFGGYDITKSLDLIFPESDESTVANLPEKRNLGLSVAIFAPGWTWEREKAGGGERSWSEWWQDDQRFWVGNSNSSASESRDGGVSAYFGPRERSIQVISNAVGEEHSVAQPESSLRKSSDNTPVPFYTNFALGSGHIWWVYGRKVYSVLSAGEDTLGRSGWTDIEACFPKADRIWPKLPILRSDAELTSLHTGPGVWSVSSARLIEYDAWHGSTSLEIVLQQEILSDMYGETDTTILPLCTLNDIHIIPSSCTEYVLEVTIKPISLPFGIDALDITPHIILADGKANGVCTYTSSSRAIDPSDRDSLDNGWLRVRATVNIGHFNEFISDKESTVCILGLRLELPSSHDSSPTPTPANTLKFLVGDMLVSTGSHITLKNTSFSTGMVSDVITWTTAEKTNEEEPGVICGTLSWSDPELQNSGEASNSSGYYNVFVLGHDCNEAYTWLGTSTYENGLYLFLVAGLEVKNNFNNESGSKDQFELRSLPYQLEMLRVFQAFRSSTRLYPFKRSSLSSTRNIAKWRKNASFPAGSTQSNFSPTLLVIGFIPIFTFGLGTWQIRRRRWKLDLIEQLNDQISREPLELPSFVNLDILSEFDFRKFFAQGEWDHSRAILVGPKSKDGVHGYQVVTPLVRTGGTTIMVDRGFISKDFVSEYRLRGAYQPTGTVRILGMLRSQLESKNAFTPENKPEKGEWYWFDFERMKDWMGGEEQGVQKVFLEEVFDGNTGQISEMISHGIPVGRSSEIELRNMHATYALTWFAVPPFRLII